MIIDGGTEEDFRRIRQMKGIDAKNGYRHFTKRNGPVTNNSWAPVREQDVPGLVYLVTNGKLPENSREVLDLKEYLQERYR